VTRVQCWLTEDLFSSCEHTQFLPFPSDPFLFLREGVFQSAFSNQIISSMTDKLERIWKEAIAANRDISLVF
jgi:hypothetical protein